MDLHLKPESLKVATTQVKERKRERETETIAQRSISLETTLELVSCRWN